MTSHEPPAEVIAIARRHGVEPALVAEVLGGVANRGFVLGDELFLRVSRPGFEDDLRKETAVVPIALAAGVLTPAIIEYDDSRTLIDAPYVVMERVRGSEPDGVPAGLAEQLARLHEASPAQQLTRPQRAGPAEQLARPHGAGPAEQLARPHGAGPAVPGAAVPGADVPGADVPGTEIPGSEIPESEALGSDALGAEALGSGTRSGRLRFPELPVDDGGDPWQIVDDLAERGYLDPGTAKWLIGWFTRLADKFDRNAPKVLIHGDVAAHNLLATPAGELTALIDWGDAAEAPRAMDFAKLPLDHVAALLPDYVHHTHPAVRENELAAHVLWFHLAWALGKLTADPWPGQRHWTAPPGSRLLRLLRFFASAPPAPWSTLT